MYERELEQAYCNLPSHTQINKSAQTNSIVLTKQSSSSSSKKEKDIFPRGPRKFNTLLPQSYLIPSPSSSPLLLINLIPFKNLHNLTSSTNRLLRAINFALQHTSRTNRLLGAVNFSLKHASGSDGLFGAVDHFGELELLGSGVVGEHVVCGWVASVCFVFVGDL